MSASRRGFSLMEVLLATSILLASSIALIELATIGRKQANAAYDLNQAQLLCQAKLDEIAAGVAPMNAVESQELEEDPEWLFSVELKPLRDRQLVSVAVSVFQEPQNARRPVRFTLVRWMPDRSSTTPFTAGSSSGPTVAEPPREGTRNRPSRMPLRGETP